MSACPIYKMTNCSYREMWCIKWPLYYATNSTYALVGSTIRNLHIRIKEHSYLLLSLERLVILKHLQKCETKNSKTDIMLRERDQTNFRLMETQVIQKHAPEINSKDEKEQYRQFLFSWSFRFSYPFIQNTHV